MMHGIVRQLQIYKEQLWSDDSNMKSPSFIIENEIP